MSKIIERSLILSVILLVSITGFAQKNCPTSDFTLSKRTLEVDEALELTYTGSGSTNSATKFIIDWGDGKVESYNKPLATNTIFSHKYSGTGKFTIEFTVQVFEDKRMICDESSLGFVEVQKQSVPTPTLHSFRSDGKCINESINFSVEMSGMSPSLVTNIIWDMGDGTVINGGWQVSHTYEDIDLYQITVTIEVDPMVGIPEDCECLTLEAGFLTSHCFDCDECLPSFSPISGKDYIVSAWVSQSNMNNVLISVDAELYLEFETGQSQPTVFGPFVASGPIIEGWQRIEETVSIPSDATDITVRFENNGSDNVYVDDVRMHPADGMMKSYVYDNGTFRLMAELDENNYATYYEYDEEGALVRIKKETERGIVTLQESRNKTTK